MRRFKIIISYDGTDFQGWQSQSHNITVADCLQATFYSVFSEKISLIGASRTDSGVHALGQVAVFQSRVDATCEKILKAWNNALPGSIKIKSLELAEDAFFPLRNVKQKTYFYNLFLERPLPFFSRYGWWYNMINRVDLDKFKEALKLYEGTHDFRSFCKLDEEKNTVRTIDKVSTRHLKRFNLFIITIKGKSFLRFQIRRMIGYALDVARRPGLPVNYIQKLLDTPSPKQTLLKASGKGLFLYKVVYKE